MEAAPADGMQAAVNASPLHPKYAEGIDRESAREKLAAKLEAGAKAAKAEAEAKIAAKQAAVKKATAKAKKDDGGIVADVVKSSAFKDFMRTAAREVVRGMFNTSRRR